jgi:hypothetical protein
MTSQGTPVSALLHFACATAYAEYALAPRDCNALIAGFLHRHPETM